MLELVVLFLARIGVGQIELDGATHVLDVGEGGLAHQTFQHDAPGDAHDNRVQIQPVALFLIVKGVQVVGKMIAAEIIREAETFLPQRLQFGATLGDDLVFFRFRCDGLITHGVLGAAVGAA